MRRRRTFLYIFIILVLILIVGLVALVRLRGGVGVVPAPSPTETPEPEETPEIETERVVVALQTIPRGMRVPPDAVEIREWPKQDRDYPEDPVFKLSDVVGKVARVEIPRQRPMSASMVEEVFLGEGSEVALVIPRGKVAIAVPVRILSAVANAIQPMDRVDVLLSFSIVEVDEDTQIKQPVVLVGGEDCLAGCQPTGEQIPRLVTQYSVQNALVLGVGLWGEPEPEEEVITPVVEGEGEAAEGEEAPPPPEPPSVVESLTQLTVVTLAVSPQDALVLKWILESNSSVDLVMRSAVDEDAYAQPEAVTLQYMVDRFQISLPPKLPHTPENEFEYQLLKEAQESAPVGGE